MPTTKPYTQESVTLTIVNFCDEMEKWHKHLWLRCTALMTHRHQIHLDQTFDVLVLLKVVNIDPQGSTQQLMGSVSV